MPKQFGIVPYLYANPLFFTLKNVSQQNLELVQDNSTKLCLMLRQKILDGAFLSPIDYARDYSIYRIVPNVCVASSGNSRAAILLFKENLREIKTIASDFTSSSEIVLSQIVMREKYDLSPQIIPFEGSYEKVLEKADAVLLSGDEALKIGNQVNYIDVVDEWFDLTELPFVHGIWVVREDVLSKSELQIIHQEALIGVSEFKKSLSKDNLDYFMNFHYELNDELVDVMSEFFKMAFYHGILNNIPEIRFFKFE